MSDIKVGDLVVVVRGSSCCGWNGDLGRIFKTEGQMIVSPPQTWRCSHCGLTGPFRTAHRYLTDYKQDLFHEGRLRRIPPLSELGEVENEQVTTT